MKCKAYILSFILVLCGSVAFGQYQGLNSQYMFNGLVINPAYTGAVGHGTFSAHYRNQWTGFDGAPTTQTISGHTPVKRSSLAFGGLISRETVGVSRDIGVGLTTSYKAKIRKGDLRFGLGLGFRTRRANWTQVDLDMQGDELFVTDGTNMIRPEFSFGAYYQTKEWYVGYSIPTLMGYGYRTSDQFEMAFDMKEMHHLVTGGFKVELNRQYVLKPSMLARVSPNAPVQFDLNTNLIINDRFWIGASYRVNESVTGLFECQINDKMRLGYSYDFTTNKIGNYSGGSHEMMVMYELRQSSFAKNPRYF